MLDARADFAFASLPISGGCNEPVLQWQGGVAPYQVDGSFRVRATFTSKSFSEQTLAFVQLGLFTRSDGSSDVTIKAVSIQTSDRSTSLGTSFSKTSFQSMNGKLTVTDANDNSISLEGSFDSNSTPGSVFYIDIVFSKDVNIHSDLDNCYVNEYNLDLSFPCLHLRLKLNFVLDPQSHELFVDYHVVKHSKYNGPKRNLKWITTDTISAIIRDRSEFDRVFFPSHHNFGFTKSQTCTFQS
ncbi:hypothetical protein V5O48_015359 [Marasmius crinis-equi]|uniref:Uncharacterized protein n=1 Tax=Marasmius crinis-equi TaxID=585013 RepID=A0ABR3EV17_9AGAR